MDTIDNINFSQRDDILKFAASGMTRDWEDAPGITQPPVYQPLGKNYLKFTLIEQAHHLLSCITYKYWL